MGINLFFRFFAGVPMEEMDVAPLLPLGCWFLPIEIYLLMVGFYLGINRKNQRFVIVRYTEIQKWWRNYFLKNMLYGGLAAIVLLLLGEIITLLASQHLPGNAKEIAMVFILWMLHGLVLLALFLFMETTKIRKIIPSMLLLLEGMTFLYGYRNKMAARFMFGTWGMYVQSKLYDSKHGFSILCVMVAQIICIAGCYQMGSYMLKRNKMEGAW